MKNWADIRHDEMEEFILYVDNENFPFWTALDFCAKRLISKLLKEWRVWNYQSN